MAFVGPFNLILPADQKANGSATWAALDPDSGGINTFSVALSANGQAPATHWGARTYLEESAVAMLQLPTNQFLTAVRTLAGERGRPLPASAAFKNNLMMDDTMGFWDFVSSKGLQPVQEPAAAMASVPSNKG